MACAKRVADIAHAAEVYARRQKLSEVAIEHTHANKVDAMTLLGQFLREAPKNKGAASGGRKSSSLPGISKRESCGAHLLADLKTRRITTCATARRHDSDFSGAPSGSRVTLPLFITRPNVSHGA